MTRARQLIAAVCFVACVFALAEGIAHSGFNPFAASDASSPFERQAQQPAAIEAGSRMGVGE